MAHSVDMPYMALKTDTFSIMAHYHVIWKGSSIAKDEKKKKKKQPLCGVKTMFIFTPVPRIRQKQDT